MYKMKNELSSIYEQIFLNESEKSKLENPSNDTVGKLKSKQELFGEKPKAVEGPEKAKVDQGPKYEVSSGSASKPDVKSSFKGSAPAKETKADAPKEVKEEEVSPESNEKEEKEEKKEQKNESVQEPVSAFEALFKKTITEEFGEENALELETSEEASEENAEEAEEELEEEGDLLSDLKDLQDKLASILSKLEDSVEENEEESEESGEEEYSEEDFDKEFGEEAETEEENPVKEAVEKPKALSDAHGKKLLSKNNKVGKLHPKGGKAHTGTVDDEPEPKVLGDKKAHLQKGKPEPKSTVKKGEFFK